MPLTTDEDDIQQVMHHIEARIDVGKVASELSLYWASLPLCIINSVWSIRSKYEKTVCPLIDRFCESNTPPWDGTDHFSPPADGSPTVSEFVKIIERRLENGSNCEKRFPLTNSRAICCGTRTRSSAMTSENRREAWASRKCYRRRVHLGSERTWSGERCTRSSRNSKESTELIRAKQETSMKWLRCAAVIAILGLVACFAQAQNSSERKVIEIYRIVPGQHVAFLKMIKLLDE